MAADKVPNANNWKKGGGKLDLGGKKMSTSPTRLELKKKKNPNSKPEKTKKQKNAKVFSRPKNRREEGRPQGGRDETSRDGR